MRLFSNHDLKTVENVLFFIPDDEPFSVCLYVRHMFEGTLVTGASSCPGMNLL